MVETREPVFGINVENLHHFSLFLRLGFVFQLVKFQQELFVHAHLMLKHLTVRRALASNPLGVIR